jgi:hypothetical protein
MSTPLQAIELDSKIKKNKKSSVLLFSKIILPPLSG